MKIVLTALDTNLAQEFKAHTSDCPSVDIHLGSIFDVECDAVVSPANSFGFMDGGIDALYLDRFGSTIQDRVRRNILSYHHGELLVGAATIVETDDPRTPFLIAAPTMRVPMWLGRETINPYLATRAVLLLIREGIFEAGKYQGKRIFDRITSVAFPGMGTGVGGVPAEICAKQVAEAIRRHHASPHSLPKSWAEASEKHQLLYTDKPIRLQR